MKNLAVTLIAVVLVLGIGGQAIAFGPGFNGFGGGYRGNFDQAPVYQRIDPATASKCLAFEQTVLPLKKRLLELKVEILSLQAQSTPDQKAIDAKYAELQEIRSQIRETAINQSVAGLCKGAGRF